MNNSRFAMIPFWIGLLYAFAFACVATWSLTHVLNSYSSVEVAGTVWNLDGPLFRLWAFSVPLGSLLAVIGALYRVRMNRAFIWLASAGFLMIVIPTVMILSSRYYPLFFYGAGGSLILLSFFSLVWLWMKKYTGQGPRERAAGSLKLIGYLFWINASWFLCGDTAKLHFKAFEGSSVPSPTETMIFLVLGWFFVVLGEYWDISRI